MQLLRAGPSPFVRKVLVTLHETNQFEDVEQVDVTASPLEPDSTRLRMGSITQGEVWRLITPIFIHFGAIHIIFNMYWLISFGGQIESRRGAWRFIALVLFTAVCSNLAQATAPGDLGGSRVSALGNGEVMMLLGGFSGVVYGLFGYVWMRVQFTPNSGFMLAPSTVMILMIWLFFCMTPLSSELLGIRVANWAHGVGLLAGMAVGYAPKLMKDLGMGPPGKKSG